MPRQMPTSPSKGAETLTASPEAQAESDTTFPDDDSRDRSTTMHGISLFRNRKPKYNAKTEALHPYVQTLSLIDLESCVALENATFPEHERCSKEKARSISFFCITCDSSNNEIHGSCCKSVLRSMAILLNLILIVTLIVGLPSQQMSGTFTWSLFYSYAWRPSIKFADLRLCQTSRFYLPIKKGNTDCPCCCNKKRGSRSNRRINGLPS